MLFPYSTVSSKQDEHDVSDECNNVITLGMKDCNCQKPKIDELTNWPISRPTDEPTHSLIYHLNDWLNEWMSIWSIDWATDQPVNWLTDQPTNQPTDWSIDWPTNCPTKQSTNWPIDWLRDQPTYWSIDWRRFVSGGLLQLLQHKLTKKLTASTLAKTLHTPPPQPRILWVCWYCKRYLKMNF